MKKLIGILIIIILVLIGFCGYYMKQSELKPVDLSATIMRDSLENAYTSKTLKYLNSIETNYSDKRIKDKAKIANAEHIAKTAEERADSAEARYNRSKTIEGCNSVIEDKNAVIKAKNNVISGYIVKSLNDSISLTISNKKCEILATSRNYYINENDSLKGLIEKNNNLIDWTQKHKFWTWLLQIR